MDFTGKTIAIGIPGGIAAYRVCDLVRELYRLNADRVITLLTPSAAKFITPLTLQALSREPVYDDTLALNDEGVPIHIAVAQQADVLVILPATCNMIAKLAHGMADDLVSTTALTFTEQPILIAPAMNTRMWKNPLFRKNLEILEGQDNMTLVAPSHGELACGEIGEGHLADQETILHALYQITHPHAGLFKNVSALVTAGGTQEALDPVRLITNKSSGKMGLALADELFGMGADVTLITTNSDIKRPYSVVHVEKTDELRIAVENRFAHTELLLMAAAVSDFRPTSLSKSKIKRETNRDLELTLEACPDILASLGALKRSSQVVVGFAAETDHLMQHAREKLERKNLDLIIANDISRSDIGFNADFNEVTLLFQDKEHLTLPRAPKATIAQQILWQIHEKIMSRKKRDTEPVDSPAIENQP